MPSVVPVAQTARILAIVQAGGQGSRMDVLTRERAKPAIPDVWVSVQY